ncbi:hypothetical protein QUF80_00435 [Desulfococcaceae bacterium HSG8]|nr:hypothetical protein [Desulfococcaceae bacterium HSG8]
MKIRQELAYKHWLSAAMEEVEEKYKNEGYIVEREKEIGRYKADLIAKRENELIVTEFKSTPWDTKKSSRVKQLRSYVVHKLGGKFNLVWAIPPKEKSIEIEDFELKLHTALNNDFPDELDSLSTHAQIEDVFDIFISDIAIRKNAIEVKGIGTIEVELKYSDRCNDDSEEIFTDSYPFEFEVILNDKHEIIDIVHLRIDTSSFYE